MGFRVAVALCLSLALVANGQIFNDLAAKENQLNCLLGKPSCVSPPPPKEPTPPAEMPPMEAPTPSEAPVPTPSEAPAPAPVVPTPAPAPVVPTPAPAPVVPTPAPAPVVPTPAPGPSAAGTAVAVISLQFPDNFIVTDQVRQQLVDLIQAELGDSATVELQVTGGRKMLQLASFTILLTDIKDCQAVALILEIFIPGRFVSMAKNERIPLLSATLNAYACTYPGEEPYTVSNPPAMAPAMVPGPAPSTTPGTGPIPAPTSGR